MEFYEDQNQSSSLIDEMAIAEQEEEEILKQDELKAQKRQKVKHVAP
jgi:hypothetical protein